MKFLAPRHTSLMLTALCAVFLTFSAFATPLDDYVAAPDDSFTYGPEPARVADDPAYTGKVWKMVSQTWRTPAEIDRTKWEHWLIVIVPKELKADNAMMFIGGGGNEGQDPPDVDSKIAQIAVATKSIVAEIKQIPNQPLKFPDEKDERYKEKGRKEDAFISYTWDKFMVTGDSSWPARLPMTKAVVRAMDVVQKEHPQVKGFFVVGGSKRGWTTWTTAAVDKRVMGIAPAVIDVLNVEHSMQHHHDVYGAWSDAVDDYQDMKVFDRMHTPEFRALCKIVDPYTYTDRLTMPKYILASTGDQFFLPDSSQYYFDQLKGERYLRYVPNTDHGLGIEAYLNLAAFYYTTLNNMSRPAFGWTREADGSIRVKCDTPPTAVLMWQANNPKARNFRLDTIGATWTSAPLTDQGGGVYVAQAPKPEQGWTAFMVEIEYPCGDFPFPLKFTTDVSVVPQTVPYRKPGGWGSLQNVGEGADSITLLHVGGDRYQMGYWYGRLLAEQIAEAWQGISKIAPITEEQYAAAIDQLWSAKHFDTTAWECEFRGIADGCMDGGHPEVTFRILQKFLTIADLSENGCSLFAAWGKATVNGDLYQLRSLDWSMDTGLQRFPLVVVYHPDDGKAHAVIGYAGMLGAAIGGINECGLVESEIQGYFGDKETLQGIPFPVLLRDILYHDATLEEATARMARAVRTNQYHYAIGDPAAPGAKAKLYFTSNTRCDQFTDSEFVVTHPCVTPNPFCEKIENAIYWKKHNGGGNQILYDAIKARYGQIDGTKAIEIAQAAGTEGTLTSIVYNATTREFWVANAEDLEPAHKRAYVRFGPEVFAAKK